MVREDLVSLPGRELSLPEKLGQRMRERFGVDLDGVRLFEDEGLADVFQQTGYATGSEIHIARGFYQPGAASGEQLVLHETGHVVQQGLGRVPATGGFVDGAALEAQADGGFTAPAGFTMPRAQAHTANRASRRRFAAVRTDEGAKGAQARPDEPIDARKEFYDVRTAKKRDCASGGDGGGDGPEGRRSGGGRVIHPALHRRLYRRGLARLHRRHPVHPLGRPRRRVLYHPYLGIGGTAGKELQSFLPALNFYMFYMLITVYGTVDSAYAPLRDVVDGRLNCAQAVEKTRNAPRGPA